LKNITLPWTIWRQFITAGYRWKGPFGYWFEQLDWAHKLKRPLLTRERPLLISFPVESRTSDAAGTTKTGVPNRPFPVLQSCAGPCRLTAGLRSRLGDLSGLASPQIPPRSLLQVSCNQTSGWPRSARKRPRR